MDFPRMIKIRQVFPSLSLANLKEEINKLLLESKLSNKLNPGMRVGITAGSRGISNIDLILREIAAYIRLLGATPVLIAAMGSHGGGSPAGQRSLLASLGITEETIGAELLCSVDCTEIGRAFYGEVYLNRAALDCQAIIVVNRIKPHTSFHGDHESGLIKMLAVGMGGPAGAASLHRCEPHLLSRAVAEGGKLVMDACPVVLGIAVLEDAYEQTRKLAAVEPEDFFAAERDLLCEARGFLPGLPVENIDILVVDQIGKNFSGTGMDTNVIGRLRIQGVPEPDRPKIKRIVVLDSASEAHGNAYGIGLADFTTERLAGKLNRNSIYLNALTSTFVQRAMVPMTLASDREALAAALKSLGAIKPAEARIIRIHNTLHLSEMLVSENLYREIAGSSSIERLGPPEELLFTPTGDLVPF
ncbi:hypothetical protein [Pelotomaculum propionicicum]|uniref:LarA-like N-terminal domain-containing protein n=1 Tax=Pelotomaculum propionicicum TaxID=258475 RepID=A0A4Y7RUK2_9FIRM|nr:hypothetical protein [Pelotomaculum propionicicum]NLI14346.1 hypothetical protein [Peptococcaceae bacterium]TEB12553.1 hypothetical protein Pmgp_00884 [Pelotomaculum propionicicum]